MSDYRAELLKHKSLKSAYQKHADSYSVETLINEINLVSALISDVLERSNWEDEEYAPIFRAELLKLIEVKRNLVMSQAKVDDIRAVQNYRISRLDAIPQADYKNAISEIVKVISESADNETVTKIISKLNDINSALTTSE
jgi:DNA-directed RNA polymerase beta subunit